MLQSDDEGYDCSGSPRQFGCHTTHDLTHPDRKHDMRMDSPNIVWLTLDSIRADHTSMHGYDRDTTPNIHSLANRTDATAFRQCISHGMSTRTSTASILTGTTPSHHQTWSHTAVTDVHALPEALTTAPALLAENGYETVGISRNPHFSSATNLDRGFDEFEFVYPRTLHRTVGPLGMAKFALNIRKHSAGFTRDLSRHSTAYLVSYVVKRQLSRLADSDQPFFLYAHYNEPHTAYHPPRPYLDTYTEDTSFTPQEAADFATERHHRQDVRASRRVSYTDDEWAALQAMYDAEILYTDRMIGSVLDQVATLDTPTIVVVTADHGDLFGEYGLTGHVHCLHDGLVHVPLVVAGIDESIRSQADELVQHVDIMQTLLAQAGVDTEQFQGVDLTSDTRDFAVSQRSPQKPEEAPEGIHAPMLTALRTPDWKYQQSADGKELYSLPDEKTDLKEESPDVREALAAKLETFLDEYGTPITEATKDQMDDVMKQRLRDLGYVS